MSDLQSQQSIGRHMKKLVRTDQWGQRVTVTANKTCVSLNLLHRQPAQLDAQQARDVAHALLHAANALGSKEARDV